MSNDATVIKPVAQGLGLTRGSALLIFLRVLGSLLFILPAMMAAQGAAEKAAQSAFFSEAPLPMPANHFFSLLGEVLGAAGPSFLPLMLLLALAYKFLLEGGAMRWFSLQAQEDSRGGGFFGPSSVVFGEGWRWFWAMLRIAIVPALILVAGLAVIGFLMRNGENPTAIPADQTAFELYIAVPGIGGSVLLLVSWLTGALALQMRAVSVVNERRNTFVALWRGLGILLRRPFQATLTYVLVTGIVAILSAGLVVGWRILDPRDGMLALMAGLWLFAIILQAFVWHWMARSAVLLSVLRDKAPKDDLAPAVEL